MVKKYNDISVTVTSNSPGTTGEVLEEAVAAVARPTGGGDGGLKLAVLRIAVRMDLDPLHARETGACGDGFLKHFARDRKGVERVFSGRSVVLAAGGYGANLQMVKKYNDMAAPCRGVGPRG